MIALGINADNESTTNDKRSIPKISTPYDDVFRTMANNCRPLLIPLVNEIFGEHYTGEEEISPSPNEHFLNKQDGVEDKRITDSSFSIISATVKKYLFECQSYPDSSILLRIFEYATQIALDEGEVTQNTLKVTIPYTAILYLRTNQSTPDRLHIEITTPDSPVSFDVRIVKIKDYSLDDIFEKNLLFLIPFYIFNYGSKKQLNELEHNSKKLEMLKDELASIIKRMEILTEQGKLNLFHYKTILDMSTKVIENLAAGYNNILKGVKDIMGGKILEYEAGTIYGEGVNAGFREGKASGFRDGEFNAKLNSIKELMKNFTLTAEQAMQAIGIPTAEQAMYLKKL